MLSQQISTLLDISHSKVKQLTLKNTQIEQEKKTIINIFQTSLELDLIGMERQHMAIFIISLILNISQKKLRSSRNSKKILIIEGNIVHFQ